ncbi:rifin PIR protein, putative [Plasmodium reichenowi]|uniref:Rifin PIR protein, putative n=1 Tax=Plasmodium reichenowi TaxID=5854 RepID=A0A2P9DCG2_PLARE|nr:rifin PIR protein, putative [Plasmodium reichenowi]
MKVHYINILLFALPLNILEHNKNKPSITHKYTNRSLCECEFYRPANYDNDPQMKDVMQQFEDRTSQRFHEYDERMKITRQKCREQCDKEIQKIILKDKLEKQMEEQLTTLETKINTDDIPTCICEKSLADKTEKFCFNCGMNVGGGVTLSSGVLGGIAEAALYAWKPTALKIAIEKALELNADKILAAGIKAGNTRGMEIVIYGLQHFRVDKLFPDIYNTFVAKNIYTEVTNISSSILEKYGPTCLGVNRSVPAHTACSDFQVNLGIHISKHNTLGTPAPTAIPKRLGVLLGEAKKGAKAAEAAKSAELTAEITKKQTALIEGGFNSTITSIYAAIIAIVVIVLIMVIIYLILRYRRKKQMKKKLQYIKLLEE